MVNENNKRKIEEESENDSDDIGPMPEAPGTKKKQRVLPHEKLYLDCLPSSDMYERSLMHRDVINFVKVVQRTDFIITTSIDGHIKFWKKTEKGIEFVKHYRAHLGAIISLSVSSDDLYLATVAVDKGFKVFDIENFDMINMMKLDYSPKCVSWIYKKGQPELLVAISDREKPVINIYDGKGDGSILYTIDKLHSQPVSIIEYNPVANVVISVDDGGMIEYWTPDPDEKFSQPKPPAISWSYKSDTDLYTFKKNHTFPTTLQFSPDYSKFVTFGFNDRKLRVFKFRTGKLYRIYDESLEVVSEMQQAGTAGNKLDDMEFGRRLALEKEIQKLNGGQASTVNAIFDDSGNFLLYPTLFGIKVINLKTNKVSRLIGKMETQRFMNISLYQGAPKKKNIITLAMAASDNPLYKESEMRDPTLFCTAYKRNRFYLFTKREPDSEETPDGIGRDIFNEKPSREEQTVASLSTSSLKHTLGSQATIHTTMGDIHIRLFPEYAPKAVENFVGLSKKGYYNNVIFHRVIKGFMIQTGDPLGDGTGGDSYWGHDFEDEFHKAVKHDRPYTVSMANAGPNTNASQFFITVVPTPWLDNKHTIFGRATAGMDVIHKIENVKCDKQDKPYNEVKILNIDIQ